MADKSRTSMTLYDVLGVQSSASHDDIRKAYKQRALQTHPDKLRPSASPLEKERAEAEFRMVTQAFQVLTDTHRRKRYDTFLVSASKSAHQRSQSPPSPAKESWEAFSEQQAKLRKEREEWAKKAAREHEERMRVLREQSRQGKPNKAGPDPRLHDPLVQKFFDELRARNPEWVQREQAVRQRQAERMRYAPRYSTTS